MAAVRASQQADAALAQVEALRTLVQSGALAPAERLDAWIDIAGWLDMPMQIKINFLCRDSILAAPIVLDLVLFLDLAKRAELKGIQEWLSFYFKSPQCRADLSPEHNIFIQHLKLKNTLRLLMGEEVLDHSGLDYYDPDKGLPAPAPAAKPLSRDQGKSRKRPVTAP